MKFAAIACLLSISSAASLPNGTNGLDGLQSQVSGGNSDKAETRLFRRGRLRPTRAGRSRTQFVAVQKSDGVSSERSLGSPSGGSGALEEDPSKIPYREPVSVAQTSVSSTNSLDAILDTPEDFDLAAAFEGLGVGADYPGQNALHPHPVSPSFVRDLIASDLSIEEYVRHHVLSSTAADVRSMIDMIMGEHSQISARLVDMSQRLSAEIRQMPSTTPEEAEFAIKKHNQLGRHVEKTLIIERLFTALLSILDTEYRAKAAVEGAALPQSGMKADAATSETVMPDSPTPRR